MNKPDKLPTFDHNGVTIELLSSGKFRAMSPTGPVTSGSLDGIKKRLDKEGVFTPFKAFALNTYYHAEGIKDFTVVGYVEPRRRFGLRQWKTDTNGTMPEVYEDTPANRELAKQYLQMRKDHRKAKEQFEKDENALLVKMKARRPEAKK